MLLYKCISQQSIIYLLADKDITEKCEDGVFSMRIKENLLRSLDLKIFFIRENSIICGQSQSNSHTQRLNPIL